MILSRVLLLALACLVAVSGLSAAPSSVPKKKAEKTAPAKKYRSAIVVDAATGNVIFEDYADAVNPPASVTKLMTFAVVNDRIKAGTLSLQTEITVEAPDTRMGGSQVWLKEKEVFTVEELLYAMMVQSGNDAAHALARTAAGSREAFVELMNAKAQELGMKRTEFRTPHGLPPESRRLADSDRTTSRDIAILSRHLLETTDILTYTRVKSRPFGEGKRAATVQMDNHNNLLGKVGGVDGLKTGFTNAAGSCISVTAARNGRRVIAVVMGSPSSTVRDLAAAELLERGFAALPVPAGSSASPISPVSPVAPVKAPPTRPAPQAVPSPVQPAEASPAAPAIQFPEKAKKATGKSSG